MAGVKKTTSGSRANTPDVASHQSYTAADIQLGTPLGTETVAAHAEGFATIERHADGSSKAMLKTHNGSWRDAIFKDWRELQYAPLDVRGDRDVVLHAINQNLQAFAFAQDKLKSDKAFVIDAVSLHGQALKFADALLRADPEVVLQAVQQNRLALQFASEEIRTNNEMVAEGVRRSGHHLQCVGDELGVPIAASRAAIHLVLPGRWREKVERDWERLAIAPPEVRGEANLVQDAIKVSFGEALQYASDRLRSDSGLVAQAVRLDGRTLRHALEKPGGPREDRKVVKQAIQQTWMAYEYVGESLRSDEEIALLAMRQSTEAMKFLPNDLRADRSFMLRAVQCDGLGLRFASPELQEDKEIVMLAAKQNWLALQHVSEEVRREVGDELMNLDTKWHSNKWLDIPLPKRPIVA